MHLILLCMYPFRLYIKLFHYMLKSIPYYSSRRTPAAKSTAPAASITFLFEFFQFPSCIWCQVCRNLNLYCCIFIAMYRWIVHCNNTLTSQTDLSSGLCSRFDITKNISINRMNFRFTAKYCCRKWNIYCCINISALTSVSRFILDINFQKQITGFSAADSRVSFSLKPDRFTR